MISGKCYFFKDGCENIDNLTVDLDCKEQNKCQWVRTNFFAHYWYFFYSKMISIIQKIIAVNITIFK